MRISTAVTFSLFAAACGGGNSDPPDIIDSPPQAICGNSAVEAGEQCDDGNTAPGDGCDATCQNEAALCSVVNDLTMLTLGTAAAPAMGDWFDVPDMGPNMGKKEFVIAAGLPPDLSTPGSGTLDGLIVELFATGGAFIINQPKTFNISAGAAAGTAAYDAASFILGDLDQQAGTVNNFYWAQSGSVSLTAVGENNGNTISGSVTATNYADVDMQGNVIAGGCTTSMAGLSFTLTQMAMAKPGSILRPGDPGAPFTRAQMELMLKIVHERKLAVANRK